MLQNKIQNSMTLFIEGALLFIATFALCRGSVIFFHEPECPEQLLK